MDFPLWPTAASAVATDVDHLYIYISLVSVVMTLLIFLTIFIFAIKYRRRPNDKTPEPIHGSLRLEITWSILPFLVMLTFFWWGAKIYFYNAVPPPNSMDVYVVAKQWMWKLQYPGGQREINELHVPTGQAVKLTLASEDVIHSFFLPALRIKHDVVPGHYDTMWFTANKPGRYHIFCAEYCGTEHSGMVGWLTVMTPSDYQNWLAGGGQSGTMAEQGERLFEQLGCSGCHLLNRQGRGPSLSGVYGSRVQLAGGQSIQADDAYLRESILNPNAKLVAGYRPGLMPSFQGQISEEGILQLIVYIKSLSAANAPGAPTAQIQHDLLPPPTLQRVSVARLAKQPTGGTQ
jgi:cytochrome c oxidase subunit II